MSSTGADGVDRPRILHCFADYGTESEVLVGSGDVVRVGIGATNPNDSDAVRADAKVLPFADDAHFDLGLFHPPCTAWADTTSISGDPEEHERENNLIPLAREIAREHCEEWIIENKPRAPLRDPVVLDGRMFGLPVAIERAFETSFRVPQPPRHERFGEPAETSPFYFSERSKQWWASVKGYRADRYPKEHLAKNCIPAPYIHYLCRHWWAAYEERHGGKERPDYSNYDEEMEIERRTPETEEGTLANYVDGLERPERTLDAFEDEGDIESSRRE